MSRQVAIKKGLAFTKRLRCACGNTTIVPKNLVGKVICAGCKKISKANAIAVQEAKKGSR